MCVHVCMPCVLCVYVHTYIHLSFACHCRSGVGVSPLVVSRLLLVLDYLLFQFREPAQQLTEQVYAYNMRILHYIVICVVVNLLARAQCIAQCMTTETMVTVNYTSSS